VPHTYQVVVTTLWRSNLGEIIHASQQQGSSSAAHADAGGGGGRGHGEQGGKQNPPPTHASMLSISFACGAVLHADQRLVYDMASQHRAAPSEYQILSVLHAAAAAHTRNAQNAGVGGVMGEGDGWVPGVRIVETSGSGKAVGKTILRQVLLDILFIGIEVWLDRFERIDGCRWMLQQVAG